MQIVQSSSATNNFCRKIVLLLDSLQKNYHSYLIR